MSHILSDIKDGISHMFYPRLCEGCSKPLLAEEDVLCLNCNVYLLPRTAYHHIPENETAMRFAGRIPIIKGSSFAYFTPDGLLQHLLRGLKYNGKTEIGLFLGRLFGYDLLQLDWAKDIDGIIPVPLHPDKQTLRGYNQSELIAEGMAEVLHTPVITDLVKRIRNTESQTQKTREERMQNMADAFVAADFQGAEGKHYLVVDDVLTTGATIEACGKAILTIPGTKISVATIGVAS